MSSFNHEWHHFKLSDIWQQWTRVKRRIGAANSSKKPIKNREVETLSAGSGGIGTVPKVSGSWAKNSEPWTLGWVSARICAVTDENKRWSAIDQSKRNYLVSCEYYTTKRQNLCPWTRSNSWSFLTGHITWGKNQRCFFFGEFYFQGQPHATCLIKINKKRLPTTIILKLTRQKISTKIPIISTKFTSISIYQWTLIDQS